MNRNTNRYVRYDGITLYYRMDNMVECEGTIQVGMHDGLITRLSLCDPALTPKRISLL